MGISIRRQTSHRETATPTLSNIHHTARIATSISTRGVKSTRTFPFRGSLARSSRSLKTITEATGGDKRKGEKRNKDEMEPEETVNPLTPLAGD